MDDFELVKQIKKGNSNAYRFMVSKHERLVFNIAWRMAGQHQADIEDIAQEVFIKVYKNIKSYRNESKLSTWIASIAWKTSIDFIRRKTRNKLNFTDEPELHETQYENNVFENIKQSELKKVVSETLAKLPVQYQSVLSLYYLEEFSYAEIQEITNMPLGTIKSYLNRAKNIFKSEIENKHGHNAIQLLYNDK
ncbi:RNA polymerase sigma factor [Labilibacter sediminis]|nr:RNA polymerase sigma factor [Labilibacter sediminis]